MSAAKRFLPNEQRQKDLATLVDYVQKLPDGATKSWLEIEMETSVRCSKANDPGRDLFRIAARRGGRPYKPIPGSGVRMSCAENAEDIIADKGARLKSAIEIARETTEQVAGRHLAELPSDAQARVTHKRATLATLALSAELARKPPKALKP